MNRQPSKAFSCPQKNSKLLSRASKSRVHVPLLTPLLLQPRLFLACSLSHPQPTRLLTWFLPPRRLHPLLSRIWSKSASSLKPCRPSSKVSLHSLVPKPSQLEEISQTLSPRRCPAPAGPPHSPGSASFPTLCLLAQPCLAHSTRPRACPREHLHKCLPNFLKSNQGPNSITIFLIEVNVASRSLENFDWLRKRRDRMKAMETKYGTAA